MSRRSSGGCFAFVFFAVLCLGGSVLEYWYNHYNEHVATCTVTNSDRGYNHESKSSEYRVYTKQCGTLSNKDAWLRGKWNSGDLQGQLIAGHTYRVRIAGWRLPFWSTFPNIVAVEGEVAVSRL